MIGECQNKHISFLSVCWCRYHTRTLIFFDSLEVQMRWLKQKHAQIGIMCISVLIFVLCMTGFVAAEEHDGAIQTLNPTSSEAQIFDALMPPYSAVMVRIYGNATLTVNDKVVHDRDTLHIIEDEAFIVEIQPEYGFHLVSLEFEGDPLVPVRSTAYEGEIQRDGTLIAVLTRWNADIPVTFSIAGAYNVSVYGKEVQDQEVIHCYPHEEMELMIRAPPDTRIAGDLHGRRLNQIDDDTYTISVTEPGTLQIEEYIPVIEEESPVKNRFVRPTPVIIPS